MARWQGFGILSKQLWKTGQEILTERWHDQVYKRILILVVSIKCIQNSRKFNVGILKAWTKLMIKENNKEVHFFPFSPHFPLKTHKT